MFIVIEIQVDTEGKVATIVTTYNTLSEAMSKYYTILSFAVMSSVPKHSAVVLDQMGVSLETKGFEHSIEVEPTPEPEA